MCSYFLALISYFFFIMVKTLSLRSSLFKVSDVVTLTIGIKLYSRPLELIPVDN